MATTGALGQSGHATRGVPRDRWYHFTVERYHRLIEGGFFTPEDKIELLEGQLVKKMPHNSPHAAAVQQLVTFLAVQLAAFPGWLVRGQLPITTEDSEPEPDLAVVKADPNMYFDHHPTGAEIGTVIEVADSSLAEDRGVKRRIYARARVPSYWIVNIREKQVEVFTEPGLDQESEPVYQSERRYQADEEIPLILGGSEGLRLSMKELLGWGS